MRRARLDRDLRTGAQPACGVQDTGSQPAREVGSVR